MTLKADKQGGAVALLKKSNIEHEESSKTTREQESVLILFSRICSLASTADILFILFGLLNGIFIGWTTPLIQWCILTLGVSIFLGGEIMDHMLEATLPTLYVLLTILAVSQAIVLATFQRFKKNQDRKVRFLCFNAVLHQDMSWYDRHNIQALPNQLNQDCQKIAEAFGEKTCSALVGIMSFFSGMCVAFYKGWLLTFCILAPSPVMFIGLQLVLKVVAETAGESQKHFASAAAVVEECFYAMKAIVSMGQEWRVLQSCGDTFDTVRRKGVIGAWKKGAALGLWNSSHFLMYTACFFSGMMLQYNQVLNDCTGRPYDVLDIIICFMSVFIGAISLGFVTPGLQAVKEASVAGARVFAIIENRTEIARCPPRFPEDRKTCTEIRTITFENIHFSYPTAMDVRILRGTTLTINQGQKIAFVGPSGCGKSTLIALLARYYDPVSGRVLINEENMRKYSISSLRSLIGYVGQEPVLFAGSLRDNFLRTLPGATEQEIGHALEQAECWFVKDLPDGIDTNVGSAGSQFSGGQKQRVTIARVLIKKPQTLLLDEATSALDNKSEKEIQATLDKCARTSGGKLTMISIAHRLSTIMGSDVIYFLKEGTVLEYGSHVSLIAKRGAYYSMVEQNASLLNAQEGDSEADSESEDEKTKDDAVTQVGPSRNSGIMKKRDVTKGTKIEVDLAEEEPEEKYKPPMRRLLDFCRPEWKYFVPSLISAFVSGASLPYCGMAMIRIMAAMMEPDQDVMLKKLTVEVLGFCVLGVCAFISWSVQFGCMGIIGEAMAKRLRIAMLNSIMRQDLGFYDNPNNVASSLGYKLQMLPHRVVALTDSIAMQACMVGAMLAGTGCGIYFDWRIALVILGSVPITLFLMVTRIKAIKSDLAGGMTESERRAQQVLAEAVQNPKAIQALVCEKVTCGFYMDFLAPKPLTCKLAGKNIAEWTLYGLSGIIGMVVVVFATWFSGFLVRSGVATFSGTQQAMQAVLGAISGISGLGAAVGDADLAKKACKDMFELLDTESLIDGLEPTGSIPASDFEPGQIEFRLVKFAYPFRPAVPIMKSMTFKVPTGTSVALVGPSGGGKSTIYGLLQRFYDPDSGQVLIGKERAPLETLNIRWWRAQIGFVGQEAILFNTNVLENVLYGVEKGSMDMNKLEDYKKMCALDFIDGPNCDGWNTRVGPKGSKLSGGQRQRVSICRAMVRDPPVLLLDEATSALDNVSEQIVSAALEEAMKGRTSFAIAHRLSTVEACDLILVCADGRVFEQGSDAELMMLDGIYAQLQGAQGKDTQACA